MLNQLDFLTSKIVAKRAERSAGQAALVGISGIDAGGKGLITEKIAQRLQELGWRVATINADDWLNLPEVCLSRHKPAEHFYKHAMRFDEMFDQLIVPLKENRAVSFVADCADAKGNRRKHSYEFRKIDIVLLEGIFLFKPAYRRHFDLTAWVDCSFATALKRSGLFQPSTFPHSASISPGTIRRVPLTLLFKMRRVLEFHAQS